jgi:hypothetical protein
VYRGRVRHGLPPAAIVAARIANWTAGGSAPLTAATTGATAATIAGHAEIVAVITGSTCAA